MLARALLKDGQSIKVLADNALPLAIMLGFRYRAS